MGMKDRIVKRLLDVGKKHRILVYPTLALVAVITAISHMIYWGKGNGRKLVVSVLVMTLLITQSLFLTSSASMEGLDTATEETTEAATEDESEVTDPADPATDTALTPDDTNTSNTDTDNIDLSDGLDDNVIDVADDPAADTSNDTNTTDSDTTTEDALASAFGLSAETKNVAGRTDGLDDVKINYILVTADAGKRTVFTDDTAVVSYEDNGETNKPRIATLTFRPAAQLLADAGYSADYFKVDKADGTNYLYTDQAFTTAQNASATTVSCGTTNSKIYELNYYFSVSRTKYTLNISDGLEDDGNNATEAYDNPVVIELPVPESSENFGKTKPSVNYTVGNAATYNYYRFGWNFTGINGNAFHAIGETFAVTSENNVVEFTSKWSPKSVDLRFQLFDADEIDDLSASGSQEFLSDATYNYGSTATLPTAESVASYCKNPAYYLAGWRISTGTDLITNTTVNTVNGLTVNGADPTVDQNVGGVTLVGVWEYRQLEFLVDGEPQVGTASLDYTYGETGSTHTISARYKNGGTASEDVTIELDAGDVSTLGTYGLGVTGATNAYTVSGTPNKTDVLTLDAVARDPNEIEGGTGTPLTITITINKRQVALDSTTVFSGNGGTDAPSKTYDGLNTISVNATAKVTGAATVNNDKVYVTYDSQATLNDNGSERGKDAGTGKSLTLTGAVLHALDGSDNDISDYYELTGVSGGTIVTDGIATVDQAPVKVTTELPTGASNDILFGQDNPDYIVRVQDKTKLAASERDLYDADPDAFLTNYLGMNPQSSWNHLQSNLYAPAGSSYTVTPTFATDGNYAVTVVNSQTVNVSRDSGENFYEIAETPVNGYYGSLTITPKDTTKYDKIRLLSMNGTGSDIAQGTTHSAAETGLSGQIFINEELTNATIDFLLYNSADHAVATKVTLTNINIDPDMPRLVAYEVNPGKPNFFAPGLTFGAYYNNMSGLNFSVTYETSGSQCTELYYYFLDESGSKVGNKESVIKNPTKAGDRYTFNFSIGSGDRGQLIVYAKNELGIPSEASKLKLNTGNANESVRPGDPYYEWIVENTIVGTTISASSDGAPASASTPDSPIWYNDLTFAAAATDDASGLNKFEWKITLPSGATDTTTETVTEAGASAKKDYGKVTGYTFSKTLGYTEAGAYSAQGVVYDNAGNSYTTDSVGSFMYDPNEPAIDAGEDVDSTEFKQQINLNFTVTEPANESGVDSVKLYDGLTIDDAHLLKSWTAESAYTYTITKNGSYTIVATDKAGNQATKVKTFNKISNTPPETPTIDVELQGEGKLGNDSWYITEAPKATVNSTTMTADNTAVTTHYKVIYNKGANSDSDTFTTATKSFTVDKQGEVSIEAYAVSQSGVESLKATKTLKVDTELPKVEITSSVVADGNVTVNFRVTDQVSGPDATKVYVNDTPIHVDENDGLITGSFTAAGNNTYTIYAYDIAGNKSDEVVFTPLSMTVSPVSAITTSGAHIEADVVKGSDDIDESGCYIEFKKRSESAYRSALVNKEATGSDLHLTNNWTGLKADTTYDYRVHAKTKTSNEEIVVSGSFKTLNYDKGTTIRGTADYAAGTDDAFKNFPIYVSLYKGNTAVAGAKITDADNTAFFFDDIPAGSYRIVATDGSLTSEQSVTVANEGITYPTDYGTKNGVHLILNQGKSTAVVLDDGDVELTVDGLEKIYNTALYKGNVTPDDEQVVANGGSIKITLHAKYVDVSGVAKKALDDGVGKDAQIVRYIELTIVKEVIDRNGVHVNETPCFLDHLYEPITVTFPLGDLAGQTIYVASLHGNSEDGYTFISGDDYESVTLTHDEISICTNMFSVYALYKVEKPNPKNYTVKWVDGDGAVMKTETVQEGKAATPPTKTPTKKATDKYTYTFARWDKAYDKITGDTVIAALFTAHKKGETNPDPGNGGSSNSGNSGNKAKDATVTPSKTATNEPVLYGYMGSADSPKTGDMAPIMLIAFMMSVSGAGAVVLSRKMKKYGRK